VRVARYAGEASWIFGRTDDARAAFGQALEIAQAFAESPVPAADRMSVLVGLHLADGDRSGAALRQALSLVPAALEDAEAWWDLPRLAEAADRLFSRRPPRRALREPLARLVHALEQRAAVAGASAGSSRGVRTRLKAFAQPVDRH
jgi:hypothetical protein